MTTLVPFRTVCFSVLKYNSLFRHLCGDKVIECVFNSNLFSFTSFSCGRMHLDSCGGYLIQIGISHLLNQNCGKIWAGREMILQQTSGIREYKFVQHNYIAMLTWSLWMDLRGGGFISLENMIFFAKMYPVCCLSLYECCLLLELSWVCIIFKWIFLLDFLFQVIINSFIFQ